jgi:hypothetical protein
MYRVLFVVHRNPELSREEFVRHYREVHVPIAETFPGLRDYRRRSAPRRKFARAVEDNESFVDRFETYPVDYIGVVEEEASRT